MKRLKRNFFLEPTLNVAQNLLGKYLIHKIGKDKIIGKIVETEAYIGPSDKASHSYLPKNKRSALNNVIGKMTKRNMAEYLIGGHIYIYLVYGMYWQLNFSTNTKGKPECVLIRALEPIILPKPDLSKIKNLSNGPGKLCQYMKLDGSHYGIDVCKSKKVWLESSKNSKLQDNQIISSARIGIDYAGKYWARRKWRFYIKDNPFVSSQRNSK